MSNTNTYRRVEQTYSYKYITIRMRESLHNAFNNSNFLSNKKTVIVEKT